jgi:hypothetical protein
MPRISKSASRLRWRFSRRGSTDERTAVSSSCSPRIGATLPPQSKVDRCRTSLVLETFQRSVTAATSSTYARNSLERVVNRRPSCRRMLRIVESDPKSTILLSFYAHSARTHAHAASAETVRYRGRTPSRHSVHQLTGASRSLWVRVRPCGATSHRLRDT